MLDSSRPLGWSKIKAIKSRLAEYDWIMWNDVDTALIMNKNIRLESFLPADDDVDLVVIINRNLYDI